MGLRDDPLYKSWSGHRRRKSFSDNDSWSDFEVFASEVEPKPTTGHWVLTRKDPAQPLGEDNHIWMLRGEATNLAFGQETQRQCKRGHLLAGHNRIDRGPGTGANCRACQWLRKRGEI